MKLLIHSRFWPSIGGVETVASILAHEWARAGHYVTITTDVAPALSRERFAFSVYHRPSLTAYVQLLHDHDVLVHFNISLRALWPSLLVRRPFVASHHGFYTIDREGNRDWRERLKLFVARRASVNIAASEAIRQAIGIDCVVIPNPYDATLFRCSEDDIAPSEDLIFVGRLVSDKGIDLLIRAVEILKRQNLICRLTIVGDGPEKMKATELAAQLSVIDQISFLGSMSQEDVANAMRKHKALVIPSLWNEPFGVVALEGIACGCAVIGSDGGGLPEALGPCGLTFERGSARDLAKKIEMVLSDAQLRRTLWRHAAEHLTEHQPNGVATRYLEVIKGAVSKR